MMEGETWISNKNIKEGVGVRIIPIYDDSITKTESILIQQIDHEHNNRIKNEIEIYKIEFKRLIQFAELLKKEMGQ